MDAGRPGLGRLLLVGLVGGVLVVGVLVVADRLARPPAVAPAPTTQPLAATRATTQPLPAAPVVRSYMELVGRTYPDNPATQPAREAIPLRYAGHIVLKERVYRDGQGCLWITHPEAQETEKALAGAAGEQVILTRETVHFAHWGTGGGGQWSAQLVCPDATGKGFELVGVAGRRAIGQGTDYDWSRAVSWGERIVVPTGRGISVFEIGRRIEEHRSPALAEAGAAHAPVQYAFLSGPLAWIPPQGGHRGSEGIVRWANGRWERVAGEGWGAGLLHLIPMADGSMLQLIAQEGGSVRLSMVSLERPEPEQLARMERLIFELSDEDPEIRQRASVELTRYGSSLWPVAERLMDRSSPEARSRLRELLKGKIAPLLGDMELVGDRLALVSRLPEGGAVFYAERGVRIPQGDEEARLVSPAWLAARPGRAIELLPWELVSDLQPGQCDLRPGLEGEWIILDEVFGARLFVFGEPMALLDEQERAYTRFLGVARGRRYVFASAAGGAGALIIDPRLADPRPRLPVWLLSYPSGTVGWDTNDWPAIRQGGAWALGEKDWRPMGRDERFFSSASEVPAGPIFDGEKTGTTRPAVAFEPGADERPLLRDAEGTYYFDGRESLKVIRADGSRAVWALPQMAGGSARPRLVRTADGRLYLFNEPGRVVRLKITGDETAPLKVEAIFTQDIPSAAEPTRIWLDPFGRIIVAYDGNKLAILFPEGYIPAEIEKKRSGRE